MGKKKQSKPAPTEGLTERDGRVYYNGRICYFWGEDGMEFVASLKSAKGRRIYYNSAESQVFMKWECIEL
jgi:hypothetical protein